MAVPLGSGCAAYGAGLGPCGHDPDDEPSERVEQEPVEALDFDPYDRVYRQNDDLSMVGSTGPIQRAATLMLPRGSIPAVATSGLDIVRIRRALPSQRARVIRDELVRAWKPLLETRQIEIVTIEIDPVPAGGIWSGRFYPWVRDLATQDKARLTGKV